MAGRADAAAAVCAVPGRGGSFGGSVWVCALPAAPLARRVARRPAPKGGPHLASPAARTPRVASFVARGRRAASQRVAAASPVAPNGQLPPRRTRQRAWGAAPRRSGMRASEWGLPSNARASRPQAGATRCLGWPRSEQAPPDVAAAGGGVPGRRDRRRRGQDGYGPCLAGPSWPSPPRPRRQPPTAAAASSPPWRLPHPLAGVRPAGSLSERARDARRGHRCDGRDARVGSPAAADRPPRR